MAGTEGGPIREVLIYVTGEPEGTFVKYQGTGFVALAGRPTAATPVPIKQLPSFTVYLRDHTRCKALAAMKDRPLCDDMTRRWPAFEAIEKIPYRIHP